MLDEIINKVANEVTNKLTNPFIETVFFKTDSELEKQIKALKELLQKYPNNDVLEKELKLCELGLQGEKEIEYELKNANIGMYVLHDINIQFQDLKAQIDYIVITSAKTYFIECKNLIGNISLDQNGNFTREYYLNKKKIKQGIYSPIRQAQRHVDVYKKICKEVYSGSIIKALWYKSFDAYNKPLVVMANSNNILNMRFAPKEYREQLIRSDRLVEILKRDIINKNKEYLRPQSKMRDIAITILKKYNKPVQEDYIKKYEEKIKESSKQESSYGKMENTENIIVRRNENEIAHRLIAFRKKKAKENNIPAYYIFTNKELEQILHVMPKTIEELKKSRILADVKIRLHGEEIIEIINS